MTPVILGLFLILIFSFIYFKKAKTKNSVKKPPGPWGLPILGHLLFLGKNPAEQFMKWKDIYGPMFSIRLGSVEAIVLNDAQLIKDALSLESLSGRPLLPNFLNYAESKGIVFTGGPRQKEQRRFAQKSLKGAGLNKSELGSNVEQEVSKFLEGLKNKCSTLSVTSGKMKIKHLFKYPVINSIWVAIIGKRFDENDPTLTTFCEIMEKFMFDTNESIIAQMSWYFPAIYPALNFFGLNAFVKCGKRVQAHIVKQIEECRADYVNGHPKHFTHSYFDKIAETNDPQSSFYAARNEQTVTTSDLFLAGLETTMTTLDWLILYMARDPKVQVKLQQEIDQVLGDFRLNTKCPSVSDRAKMPYSEAVVNELLRITSPVPFGVYHCTLTDIELNGYTIPKNTTIIPNFYGVDRNPDVYERPNDFYPERFLNPDGTATKLSSDFMAFGFGKRSCIGESFARDQLFLISTSFFQQYSVSCTNEAPSIVGKFGLVLSPKAFHVILTERIKIM